MSSLAFQFAPLPTADAIANARDPNIADGALDPNELRVTKTWIDYFTSLAQGNANSAQTAGGASVSGAAASIPATDLTAAGASAGLYRVCVYARITTPGTVSSSLAVTISWSDGGVSQSSTYGPVTGNTTTTLINNPPIMVNSDASSPISYSTAYASVGATPMQHSLLITLEKMP